MSAYVGRYHRVRPIGPHGIGAPYVWDRGRAQDAPRMIPAPYDRGETYKGFTRYGEWWRSPEGIWTPTIRGGAGGTYISGRNELPGSQLFDAAATTLSQSVLALDSAYTYNSAGDAIGNRFVRNSADTLATVYFFITSYTGTAANVNDLSLELRDNSVTVGPSTTLHESKIVDPASATGWIASTGWTFSLVANTQYWLIVGDADGGVTDFATVLRNVSQLNIVPQYSRVQAVSTTDGWASVRTFAGSTAAIVIVNSTGITSGAPFSSSTASTSSTNRRGLRFIAPTTLKVFGMTANASSANISGIDLWEGSTGPSGAPAETDTAVYPANVVAGTIQGRAFNTPPTLTQGTVYRLVFTYSGTAVTPAKWQIGTGADATLRSAMAGGGNWYWTEANGTTDWSNDDTSAFPAMDVVVEDFVTEAGGGGGGLVRANMSGGLL